jgi:hypothetical protein
VKGKGRVEGEKSGKVGEKDVFWIRDFISEGRRSIWTHPEVDSEVEQIARPSRWYLTEIWTINISKERNYTLLHINQKSAYLPSNISSHTSTRTRPSLHPWPF